MQHLPIFVQAANLTKSPCNVRKSSDAFSDAQLEANIAAKGLRQNLIGLPVSRKKGHYRIIAGGRRLDAVHRLIEKGVFDADYEVPVLVLDNPKEAIETSLEENFFVQAMNPADTCRAFQDIIEGEGKTPEEIAIRFGLTTRFVKSRLALADLTEPVFDALRNGEITLTVAIAYASATSNRARQAEVYELLRGTHGRSNVDMIRRELVEGTYTGADPKALLVGRDAYQAAGGRFHGDLFTDADTERWIDGGILDTLAAERLAVAAEAIREREGFAEVRIVPRSFVSYNETWDMRPIRGELPPLSEEEQARLEAIEAELDEANDSWPDEQDDDVQEEWRQRVERLEAEQASIGDRMPILSDEQKAGALAFVVIGEDGEPSLHHQLYLAPADNDDDDDDDGDGCGDDGEGGDKVATVGASTKSPYSQRLVHELAEMKSELLRIHIARDTHFALDLAAFWMADGAVRTYRRDTVATELRADEPSSPLFDYHSDTRAAEEWDKLGEGLDRSWADIADPGERFDAFCALSEDVRAGWLAWVVARSLHAVSVGATGSDFINHLGLRLGIDVASWWRPTAANYFDRLTKAAILGHLEEVGGKELASRYGGSKKHELAASAEHVFAATVPIEAEIRERALTWVPNVMRFTPADAAADTQSGGGDEETEASDITDSTEDGEFAKAA